MAEFLYLTNANSPQKLFKNDGFSSTILDSFDPVVTNDPYGIVLDDNGDTYVGHNSFFTPKAFKFVGFTSTLSTSISLSAQAGNNDIAFIGSDLVTVDSGNPTDKVRRYTGFSNTINDSFEPPASASGVTWDGSNIILTSFSTDKIYKMSGFSNTISDSFAAADNFPQALLWYDGNLYNSRNSAGKIVKYSGFSNTVTDSFVPSTGSNTAYGLWIVNEPLEVNVVDGVTAGEGDGEMLDEISVLESIDINAILGVDIFEDVLTVTEFVTASLLNITIDSFEAITITENTQQVIDVQNINIFDAATVAEQATADIQIEASASDAVTVTEDQTTFLPELSVNRNEAISITEVETASLDELSVDVFEMSGLLITESISVIDLIVEVGVVADFINPTEQAQAELDQLFADINEAVTITDNTEASLNILHLDVNDAVGMTEQTSQLLNELHLSVNETPAIIETITMALDDLIVSVAENMMIDETPTAQLDALFASAEDNIGIADVPMLTDLVVELGPAVDATTVIEDAEMLLDVLSVDGNDAITVAEFADRIEGINMEAGDDIGIGEGEDEMVDNVAVTESASAVLETNIEVDDTVTIVEDITASVGALNFSVFEVSGLLITEHVDVIDLIVEVGVVAELVLATENAEASLDALNLDVEDSITATENVTVFDTIVELGIIDETIGVTEGTNQVILELNVNQSETITTTEGTALELGSLFITVNETFLITDIAILTDLIIELGVVADLVTATEDTTISLDALNVDTSDLVTITEQANVLDIIIEIGLVFDTLTITEFADRIEGINMEVEDTIGIGEGEDEMVDDVAVTESATLEMLLTLEVNETITATEDITVTLGGLNISVFEMSGLLITESISVIDLIVEVGVVAEFTGVTEAAQAGLNVLNIAVDETLGVVEATGTESAFDIGLIFEAITITEQSTQSLDELNIAIDEAITVTENLNMLDTVIDIEILFETLTVTEAVTIFDIIIELGPLDETITAAEAIIISLGELSLNVEDTIAVVEDVNGLVDILEAFAQEDVTVTEITAFLISTIFIDVSEAIGVTEFATIHDITVELGIVSEDINTTENVAVFLDNIIVLGPVTDLTTAQEDAQVSLVTLNVSVVDLATATESVQMHDIVVEMPERSETITVTESIQLSLGGLVVDVSDAVGLADVATLTDLVIELGPAVDTVTILENVAGAPDVQNAFAQDEITAQEFVQLLDIFVDASAEENVTVTEDVTMSLDVLHAFVLDPFHVLITEVAMVVDIVVEIGVVMDPITVTDSAEVSIAELFATVDDLLAIIEITNNELPLNCYVAEEGGGVSIVQVSGF